MSSYQDVLAAVREYIQDPEHGSFTLDNLRWALTGQIPGSAYPRSGALTPGYSAQVLRAAGRLAEEGTLLKKGTGRKARYWTPAAWDQRQAERNRWEAERAVAAERWGRVRAGLAARGYGGVLADTGTDIRLPLETWEKLLDELGNSTREQAGR